MWAAEPITSVTDAKRVSVEILKELVELAPKEDLLPAESQPSTPGERPRHLMSCSKSGTYQYPGASGLLFRDDASAKAYERKVHEYMRAQEGWSEVVVRDDPEQWESEFTSNNGFTVSATKLRRDGVSRIMLLAFSPCFEMPDDFQQSVDKF